MRYAFSTLACPGWTIAQVLDAARRFGYDGVELRLLDGAVIDPQTDATQVERAVALCRAAGVDVCALDTSCRFNEANPDERARQVAELRRWIGLAQGVAVPLLRVFGGSNPADLDPAPPDAVGNAWVADALAQVAPAAEAAGVTVVLETHDAFSSALRVAAVLAQVGSSHIGALWDSHHPYRVGETPDEVIQALGGQIRHVHIKDARRPASADAPWELVLLGEGDVPVREQLRALARAGYSGYLSVEWEKKWHPELAEPEIALPQHLAWLKRHAPGD